MAKKAITPGDVYRAFREKRRPSFLFESRVGGRWSFVGTSHQLVLSGDDDPTPILRGVLGGRRRSRVSPNTPPFVGGILGYIGYEAVRCFEKSAGVAETDTMGIPTSSLMFVEDFVAFDHATNKISIVAKDQATKSKLLEMMDACSASPPRRRSPLVGTAGQVEFTCLTTREEFIRRVVAAKEYIAAGDVFQVVLSQRFETDYAGDPLLLYEVLSQINPSPYMFCMEFEGFALVGASPETHVRCRGGKVYIRPIAGTRPRGKTEEEDAFLAAELLADEKERAEHVMLVDLARNDVGKVSRCGSVDVTEFMKVKNYSHVMHIESEVEGVLAPGRDAVDVLAATFPAGTLSGAPKIRATQIIAELEGVRRGPYGGCVGYVGYDGNFDTCITIRTAFLKGGRAFVQTGAGIVADSVPEKEHEECLYKAQGMFKALAVAKTGEEE